MHIEKDNGYGRMLVIGNNNILSEMLSNQKVNLLDQVLCLVNLKVSLPNQTLCLANQKVRLPDEAMCWVDQNLVGLI